MNKILLVITILVILTVAFFPSEATAIEPDDDAVINIEENISEEVSGEESEPGFEPDEENIAGEPDGDESPGGGQDTGEEQEEPDEILLDDDIPMLMESMEEMPMLAMSQVPITIDLSTLSNAMFGEGWSYTSTQVANTGTDGKLTFHGNHVLYGSASGNVYNIVRSIYPNANFARHIEISSDVNDVTVIYDGPNIKVYKNGTNPYVQFNSDVTVKGGSNNTVIYNDVVNLNNSTFTIDSGAVGTNVLYNGLSHQDTYNMSGYSTFTFNNNGADTALIYDRGFIRTLTITSGGTGAALTFKGGFKSDSTTLTSNGAGAKLTFDGVNINNTVINHNNTTGAMKMYTGGVNSFAQIHNSYFRFTQAAGANLEMFLGGTTTIGTGTSGTHNAALYGYGYITVPQGSSLTIDSADKPGSDQGFFAISRNDSTAAVIGSVGNTNGLITINGGTTKAVMTYATLNNSTGAAIGSGAGGNGTATVIINGGKVIAKAVNGAGIGSGEGSGSVGNVTINGGAVVDARNTTASDAQNGGGGAAIGGGRYSSSNVIIENGAVVTAKSSHGAAIGGGQNGTYGDYNIAVGKVTINGGKIDAESVLSGCGAAIGGGGSTGQGGPKQGIPNVNINGGELKLKSYYGANIGRGGNTANPDSLTALNNAGFVNIYKARIVGDFSNGNCIGVGQNAMMWPTLYISTEADIIAFGRLRINMPGIDAGEFVVHPGTTYVNASFGNAKGAADGLMVVYDKNDPSGIPVRIEEIPFACHLFTYTTGTTAVRTDHVFTGTFSGGLDQIVRVSVGSAGGPNKEDIYSVNMTRTYYNNGHTLFNYFRNLEVEYGGSGFIKQVPVREYYVDIYGNPIPDKNYSVTLVPMGSSYEIKTAPEVDGYIYKGFKWYGPPDFGPPDSSGSDFTTGLPPSMIPQLKPYPNPETIYLVFTERPTEVDVTVSKTVVGKFGDRTKPFAFTVTFKHKEGALYDPGEEIAFDGGMLVVGQGGKASFTLTHGQNIRLLNIPVDALMEIEEDLCFGYTTSFKDSATNAVTNGYKTKFETVGLENRTFDFTNTEMEVNQTGISGGSGVMEGLIIIPVLVLLAGLAATGFIRRKLWTR